MRKGKIALLFSLAILSVSAVGGTWAVWLDELWTGNEYMIPRYKTELEENFNPPENWMPGITYEKEVWVSNDGKDGAGKTESAVPVMVKVQIDQSWSRLVENEAGELVVQDPEEHLSLTFEADDGTSQFAAIPDFNSEKVCVLGRPEDTEASLQLGLHYYSTMDEVQADAWKDGYEWVLVNENPEDGRGQYGSYVLYYLDILEPGQDTSPFLLSVKMNPLLKTTISEKHTTYEKTEGGYIEKTEMVTSGRFGYEQCRYTMDITATTVQATKDAVEETFGNEGGFDREVVHYLKETAGELMEDASESPQKRLSVVYNHHTEKLEYVPVRKEKENPADPNNWFMSFTDMLPGGVYKDKMVIDNDCGDYIRVYMQIVPRADQDEDRQELLHNLHMVVTLDGEKLYEGDATGIPYGEGSNLQNLIPLCYISAGSEKYIEVTLTVNKEIALDPETGECALADKLAKIDWMFKIQKHEDDDDPSGGNPSGGNPSGGSSDGPGISAEMIPDEDVPLISLLPQTGDYRTRVYGAVALASFLGMVLLIVTDKKKAPS